MAEPNRTVLTESDITDPGPLKTALDSAGGGGGAVSSVNGSTGDVTLDAGAVGAQPALSGSIPYVDQSGTRTSAPYTPQTFPGIFAFTLSDQSIGLENVHSKVNGLLVRSGIQTLTNPTTIPVDGPERLDLVFTEPTMVAFATPHYSANPSLRQAQAPGVTDLVLSIEGYEHVTWSGVVVHGTPDQSGVVWASALWRQRNSSWHLLCEQDASQVGGGGLEVRVSPGRTKQLHINSDYDSELKVTTYPVDANGYSTMVSKDVSPAVKKDVYDHVARHVRLNPTYPNLEYHNMAAVKTGNVTDGYIDFIQTKGWVEAGGTSPSGGKFTDGIHCQIRYSLSGPEVTSTVTMKVRGTGSLNSYEAVKIGGLELLDGIDVDEDARGDALTWGQMWQGTVGDSAGIFLQVNGSTSYDPEDRGVLLTAYHVADGAVAQGVPVEFGVNPDSEDGMWTVEMEPAFGDPARRSSKEVKVQL